jgi:transposase
MIDVDIIEDIRKRLRRGESVASVARAEHVSEPTVRRYRDMQDLSPRPPKHREQTGSTLAPYTACIDAWLEEDIKNWRKQRHSATRIYARLKDEKGYAGSYSTVQRYVKKHKEEMAAERDARDAQGYLELEWSAGEGQVDFGEADFRVRGTVRRGKYLTVSFPHSNVGITQIFWGETSECVCEGLKAVFEFIEGVPQRLIFDNATEVGRRFGSPVRTSSLFKLFSAHYGFDYSFTNPQSGNEKGNVENKIGFTRRNLFVPIPAFSDVKSFNRRLMQTCLNQSKQKRHWRCGREELELFKDDRDALASLPPQAFSCVRWEARKCNKQGIFTLGGIHRYSAGPAYANQEVIVALGAFDVNVIDSDTGEVIASYERAWQDVPTSSSDPTLQLKLLAMRPGGWKDSSIRDCLPQELVAFFDRQPRKDLARDLRVLRDVSEKDGWKPAVKAMSAQLERVGSLDEASVGLVAAYIASGQQHISYDEDIDLSIYDGALKLFEGGDERDHNKLQA